MPKVVDGLRLHNFHWLVPPTPISCAKTDNQTLWWVAADASSQTKSERSERYEGGVRSTHILWDTGAFGVERHTWSDGPAHLQFSWCLHTHKGRQHKFTWPDSAARRSETHLISPSYSSKGTANKWSTLSYIITLYLDFQDATKGHAEVPVVVFAKHSLEGLFKQGGIEGVSHHDVPPVSTSQQVLYSVQQITGVNV